MNIQTNVVKKDINSLKMELRDIPNVLKVKIVDNYGINEFELEVIKFNASFIWTKALFSVGIQPCSSIERKNKYIMWDRMTLKRKYFAGWEDERSYCILNGIRTTTEIYDNIDSLEKEKVTA